MKILSSLKNCEGCRNRKRFIKEVLAGIGLMFLWPFKTKAQLQCYCTLCRVGDLCLCCDPFCDHCAINNRERCCVHVLEFCDGVPTYTAVCCPNGTCPGISKTASDEPAPAARWKLVLDNGTQWAMASSNENLDPLPWLAKHKAEFKDRDGKVLTAVTANRLF